MKSEEKKQLKFLMVLPVLALPFLTIAFVALGGGSGVAPENQQSKPPRLSAEVPGAQLEDKPMNKLSYYQAAASDSSRKSEMMKNDPYYRQPELTPSSQQSVAELMPPAFGNTGVGIPAAGNSMQYADPNEARVYQRLNALNNALNTPQEPGVASPPSAQGDHAMGKADVDRLEKMMQMMQHGGSGDDPELTRLSGMLENILDIQHPARVQEKLRRTSAEHAGQVFSVAAKAQKDPVSMLVSPKGSAGKGPGFYGLADVTESAAEENSIRAVVHQTQTVVDGAVIKLRLLSDIYINGVMIPGDNFLYGFASLRGERLSVKVESIRYGNSLFPVQLAVYDLDGLPGIHIPGAIGRDVAKQSGTNALQGLSMGSLDPSLGAQAASAGIELSKSLLGKKVKQVKVTVKAGYQVLLFDENQKNQ